MKLHECDRIAGVTVRRGKQRASANVCAAWLRCKNPSSLFLFTPPPIFAHAVRVTHSLCTMRHTNRGGGGCPNCVRILPLAVRPPPLFATRTHWRVHPDRDTGTIPTTPTDALMVGTFSHGTSAPLCSCLVDTHHISTVYYI